MSELAIEPRHVSWLHVLPPSGKITYLNVRLESGQVLCLLHEPSYELARAALFEAVAAFAESCRVPNNYGPRLIIEAK